MSLAAWHDHLADLTGEAAASDTPALAADIAGVQLAVASLPEDSPTALRLAALRPSPLATAVLSNITPGAYHPTAVLLALVRAVEHEQVVALRAAVETVSGPTEPRTPHEELVARLAADQDRSQPR